jgi:hypothetical protein
MFGFRKIRLNTVVSVESADQLPSPSWENLEFMNNIRGSESDESTGKKWDSW